MGRATIHRGNPGAWEAATGVEGHEETWKPHKQCSVNCIPLTIPVFKNPKHESVARSIGYVLTLESEDAWWGLSVVLRAKLEPEERAALAFMALKAIDRNQAVQTAEAALGGAGMPIVPLFEFADEASFWADMAVPEELDAYAVASANRMAPDRLASFAEYLQGRVAA